MSPDTVLSQYSAAISGLKWSHVANAGFSGATVWCGESEGIPHFALKAYPPGSMNEGRLLAIHGWLRAAGRLPFVPRVLCTVEGTSFVEAADRFWEFTSWMPGTADFHQRPTRERLEAACAALAELHRIWQPASPISGPVPGIERRLHVLAEFREWSAANHFFSARDDLLRRTREQVQRLLPTAEQALLAASTRKLPLYPCLCDVWHDHVLFTGDAITGVIDYGAMKIDHAAVDLARLLGSLVPGDRTEFIAGLTAYRTAGGVLEPSDSFVWMLARTGTICAAAVWLLRFFAHGAVLTHPTPATSRIEMLVTELERILDVELH